MAYLPLFKTEGEALDFLKHLHVCMCMSEPACAHTLVHVQVRPWVGPSELELQTLQNARLATLNAGIRTLILMIDWQALILFVSLTLNGWTISPAPRGMFNSRKKIKKQLCG